MGAGATQPSAAHRRAVPAERGGHRCVVPRALRAHRPRHRAADPDRLDVRQHTDRAAARLRARSRRLGLQLPLGRPPVARRRRRCRQHAPPGLLGAVQRRGPDRIDPRDIDGLLQRRRPMPAGHGRTARCRHAPAGRARPAAGTVEHTDGTADGARLGRCRKRRTRSAQHGRVHRRRHAARGRQPPRLGIAADHRSRWCGRRLGVDTRRVAGGDRPRAPVRLAVRTGPGDLEKPRGRADRAVHQRMRQADRRGDRRRQRQPADLDRRRCADRRSRHAGLARAAGGDRR